MSRYLHTTHTPTLYASDTFGVYFFNHRILHFYSSTTRVKKESSITRKLSRVRSIFARHIASIVHSASPGSARSVYGRCAQLPTQSGATAFTGRSLHTASACLG